MSILLHIIAHTYSEAVIDQTFADQVGDVCVNPLGWALDGGLAHKDYHLLDYPVFHKDIRENAKLRVATYLARIGN
ncbi:MAG: hypothetical protein O3A63_08520 [Proteobacteria bacterium]|nr:hypothetical protein [Pseudomonadota bacterium]